MAETEHPLAGVEAFLFDVFGTVVDWRGSVADQLAAHEDSVRRGLSQRTDWLDFVDEWRAGYWKTTARVAGGGEGPLNVDVAHREILDSMLSSPKWKHLGESWGEDVRGDIVLYWHTLQGWPDSLKGLERLKESAIIGTLSNGSVRLLIDMAKNSGFPWDVILCSELLGSYKPNPQVYLSALHHLALPAHKVCMVASHIYDLRAAGALGFKTVYIERETEDVNERARGEIEGVDLIVNGFGEIADALGSA